MMSNSKFRVTSELKVSQKIADQVIGQEDAVKVIKKAAQQRRHVLLIGEPGTGKCVGKDTLILTDKEGLVTAEELFDFILTLIQFAANGFKITDFIIAIIPK